MKKFVAASFFVATLSLVGCEPAATFDKPQPERVKSLTSFPKRLQGKYISSDRASIVAITDRMMTRHFDFEVKEHKDSIGSSYQLAGDTLICKAEGTKERVVIKGDSVIYRANWSDTLFQISTDNVLKRFKGHYFLNTLYDSTAWEVHRLTLQNGILSLGSVSGEEDILKLREITETIADTIATHFALSRKQFKTFIRDEGFGKKETFVRIAE